MVWAIGLTGPRRCLPFEAAAAAVAEVQLESRVKGNVSDIVDVTPGSQSMDTKGCLCALLSPDNLQGNLVCLMRLTLSVASCLKFPSHQLNSDN